MPSPYAYHLTDKTLTVFIGGKPLQADRSNPQWADIKAALKSADTTDDYLTALMTPIRRIADAVVGNSRITVRDNIVFFGDQVVDNVLSAKILDILNEDLDLEPWIKFAENCYANPSKFAQEELYLFLEKAELPITPDGCFIAYKRLRADFTDVYSGRFDNKVGSVVIMPGGRAAVDDRRHVTCSRGLHFCSKGYLDSFGGPILVLVKINPADVVSIPSDYHDTKGRCWRYEVVDVVDDRTAQSHRWPAISAGHNERWGYDPTDPQLAELDEPVDLMAGDIEAAGELPPAPADGQDVQAKRTKKPVTPERTEEPVVQSITHGAITLAKFNKLVKKHGTPTGVARALGMSAGTIQGWKTKLGWTPEA